MGKQEEVTISVKDINNDLNQTEISLSNHTACNCSCNQECNSATQRLNQDSCSCECIEDGSHCEEANKKWIKGLCKCECRLRPIIVVGQKRGVNLYASARRVVHPSGACFES